MRKLRKNIARISLVLIALFLLLAGYGAYTISVNGNRWFSSTINEFAREKRADVIPGDILDRNGVVLASADAEGKRNYPAAENVRRATVHAVGSGAFNMKSSTEYFFASSLYGFNLSLPEKLGFLFSGQKYRGDNVQLTIDSRLAAYVDTVFPGDKRGAVLVMNYKTGEVLTEQSFPAFDPAHTAAAPAGSSINRCTQSLKAPGSTFKMVTAASAMENFSDYQTRVFHCEGQLQLGNRTVVDAGTDLSAGKLTRHGDLTLQKAFQASCNNIFASIALELGDQKLRATAEKFGFNDNFLFRDIVVENSSYPLTNRTDAEIAWTGAGQSALAVSPLHMCMVASSIANGGVMMEPRTLVSVTAQSGAKRASFSPRVYRRPLTAAQADVLKGYMRGVVTGGTGTAAAVSGVKVCGKTGSAEIDTQENTNAWFVGFLDEPESPYALAVVVEDAGGGGSVAAPIAQKIFSWLVKNEPAAK